MQAPINCVNAFGTPLPIDVEVIKAAIPLGSHDSFSHGRIKRSGSSTKITASYRSGRFHVTYRHLVKSRNLYEGGTETCDTGKLRLTFKPGHRRALKTGLWVGQTAEQEPVELSVVAGGRALQTPLGPGPGGTAEYAFQIAGNSSTDPCAYEIASPLFIEPNGTFSNSNVRLGDDAVVTGTFTGRSSGGSGQFSYQAQSCLQEGWSASWSFR